MNCIYRSFKADPRNENRRNSNVSPVVVGHHIEISNRFICYFEAATYIAKQCKTMSCHKSPFAKGGFRGNVNVIEDSNGCSRSADSL
jgi:hypothetical protein